MKCYIALMILTVMIGCSKYQEITDAPYPEQNVYMPAGVNGFYDISVTVDPYQIPTSGSTTRYSVDNQNNKLIIPLGVYRGGLTNDGEVRVSLVTNDTLVSGLIAQKSLDSASLLLSSTHYSFPSDVAIAGSKDYAAFNVLVDLNYIKANMDQKFAFAISISNATKTVSDTHRSTVVIIDPSKIEELQTEPM